MKKVKKQGTTIKLGWQDRLFDIINYSILGVFCLMVLYPLYFVLIASISNPQLVNSGQVILIPKGIMWDAYDKLLQYKQLWVGYRNTIFYTIIGTFLNIVMTLLTAYPMSRPKFHGRKIFLAYMMLTMYFSGGLVPTYLVMQGLGLVDNWMIMIVMGMISITNVIVCITYLRSSIPPELYEAGFIDGLSHFGTLTLIVVPLSKPILAVMALYYGVSHWNDFWNALIYLSDPNYYPLQLILRGILTLNEVDTSMLVDLEDAVRLQNQKDLIKYGSIIVSSLPLLIIYPFLQKYFVKGVMIGSLKG